MGTLARRLAPAAALGGLAIAIVGLLDPALVAGRSPAGDDMTAMAPTDIAAQQGAVIMAGNTLCEAYAVVWPTGERQSRQISIYAVPEFDAQATQQGIILDGVSDATCTTGGYRESLQQLLDSL